MGAQVILCDGFEVAPPPDMSDRILFETDQSSGSNCDESTITTEVFSRDSSPGGAPEEECPEPKPFSFYFVKQHPYDDTHIKAKINEADSEIYHCNKRRIDISITQKSARASLSSMYAQMESLGTKSEGCKAVYEAKKREFDSLKEGLRCSSTDQLCFSKEELDHLVYMARYVSEHGSIGFEDEDWLLKETDKHDTMSLSEESFAEKDAFIHRVKSMAVELNEVKKELEAITWNINQLSDKMGQIQNKIMVLDAEMAHVLDQRDKSYEKIKMLRKLRDKGNAEFFQSIAVMRKAKELAVSGNVRDLEVYASAEVDKFMTRWNNDKGYRDDYVKGISFSLRERQLSQDGRVRDHEGELVHEKKALVNNRKEGEVIHEMNVITDKQKKEARNKEKGFNKPSAEESDVTDLDFPVYEKEEVDEKTLKERKREEVDEETLKERKREEVDEETLKERKREEVDEETLKERKREEELEKARFAMERKRKLQEKAAAKAAIRAQKEAEKKLKECEKKAKKKAAATLTELDQAMNEMEEVSTLAVSGKERQRSTCPKKRSFRYKHRVRGTEAIPKAILNRRKARKYWRWGLWSAALALSLFLLFLLLK